MNSEKNPFLSPKKKHKDSQSFSPYLECLWRSGASILGLNQLPQASGQKYNQVTNLSLKDLLTLVFERAAPHLH